MVVATQGWQAQGIRMVTRSLVNHAVLMVSPYKCVEAAPGGATVSNISQYNGMFQRWSNLLSTDVERDEIVALAMTKVGIGYSWLDDACIAATDILGVHVPKFIRSRLCRPDRLMCSQLVDTVYLESGYHLFKDGRLPGDVSPGDLLDLIEPDPRKECVP